VVQLTRRRLAGRDRKPKPADREYRRDQAAIAIQVAADCGQRTHDGFGSVPKLGHYSDNTQGAMTRLLE
jgi:hypothetical protein